MQSPVLELTQFVRNTNTDICTSSTPLSPLQINADLYWLTDTGVTSYITSIITSSKLILFAEG